MTKSQKVSWTALKITKQVRLVSSPHAIDDSMKPVIEITSRFLLPILSDIYPDAGINNLKASKYTVFAIFRMIALTSKSFLFVAVQYF